MDSTFRLKRLPITNHPSLKAWSAADELMVERVGEEKKSIAIYNDSFGYLTTHLSTLDPYIITDLKSQETAIRENLEENNLELESNRFSLLTEELLSTVDMAVLKIPKSQSLFEKYLQHIHKHLSDNGEVICGFMTKYFSSGLLDIAKKYFENVEQSRAQKKARLILLRHKKAIEIKPQFEAFQYHHLNLKQHRGIFSSGKIDKATDFLLQNISIPENHNRVLDLACGNGIIGKWILDKMEISEMHFLDDSFLALDSARFNVEGDKINFHHQYNLSVFEDETLDWIVINPPFHFGNTIDTSIPINLFKEAYHKLVRGGILTIVANSNLGYESFLKHQFKSVEIQKSNRQFKIYKCCK